MLRISEHFNTASSGSVDWSKEIMGVPLTSETWILNNQNLFPSIRIQQNERFSALKARNFAKWSLILGVTFRSVCSVGLKRSNFRLVLIQIRL